METPLEEILKEELEALFEEGQLMILSIDLKAKLDLSINIAKRIFKADRVSIMLFENEALKIVASYGLPQEIVEKTRVKLGEGVAGLVAQTGEPLLLSGDLSKDKRFKSFLPKSKPINTAIVYPLSVPLKTKSRIIGVFNVGRTSAKKDFTYEDMQLLKTMSAQLAYTIENDYLSQELSRKARETRILHMCTSVLNSSLDLNHILPLLLEIMGSMIDVRGSCIFLAEEEESPVYELKAKKCVSDDLVEMMSKEMEDSDSPIYKTIQTSQPHYISHVKKIQKKKFYRVMIEEGFKSFLCLPLSLKNRSLGFFCLFYAEPKKYTEEDINFLMIIANETAQACENALLYHKISEEAEKLYHENIREQCKHETILGSMSEGVVVTDLKDNVLLINSSFREIFSYYDPIDNKSIDMLVDNPSFLNTWKDVITTGKPFKCEFGLQNGKFIRAFISQVKGADERSIGMVSLFEDITHEIEASRIKDEFISLASHELRTPLASIKAYSESLLEDKLSEKVKKEYLRILNEESDRLARIINELLTLSKLKSGKIEFNRKKINFEKVVRKIVNIFKAQNMHDKIEFILSLHTPSQKVYADEDKLGEIFMNLLSNAIKYSPDGGKVIISTRNLGKYAEFSIKDEGIGMTQEDTKRIFDGFYRTDLVKMRGISGTGLGLVIVKRYVEGHGGEIEVESQPGKGSTFTVKIPKGLK